MRILGHGSHANTPHAFEGRHSRFYDLLSRRVVRRLYRRLAADIAAAVPANAAVLDVGTGPGVLLVELARRRPDLRLTGIDLSADMVTAAVRNLAPFGDRATAQVGDVARLPFSDDSFDVIVSSLSLHHWDEPDAAVGQLARVLRPTGQVRVYDLPRAPFGKLAAAAQAGSVLNARAPQATPIRTGIPFLRLTRYVMAG